MRFAAKLKPHRPGITRALDPRAGIDVFLLYRGPRIGAIHETFSVRDHSLFP
jgi:hypothetical protein